jgi:hypothetical protein
MRKRKKEKNDEYKEKREKYMRKREKKYEYV